MVRVTYRVFLAAMALVLGTNTVAPSAVRADDFTCTEVVGYSQTMQWYFGGFVPEAGRGRWQLRWQGGGSIDLWADPSYEGWAPQGRVNSCAQNSERPDRVLLDVSDDFHTDVNWWVQQINATLSVIHRRYPSARQIMLQPVVGGPGGSRCQIGGQDVRASFNHPYILEGIGRVVGGDVTAGANPMVRSCGDYADTTGHLNDQAKGAIGVSIGQFYALGQVVAPLPTTPTPAPAPQPTPAAPAVDRAAFCPPEVGPDFTLGFAQLKSAVGNAMGDATGCEHGDPLGSGDVLQETTTGLAFYRVSTNTPTFTDGWSHWALTPGGEVFWTGASIDPPN
jgi:hypothetical protein